MQYLIFKTMTISIALLGVLFIGFIGTKLERNYLDQTTKKSDKRFF